MRLLDCGCGPGAITLGLADVVAPGEVVGVDVAPSQVEAARALAAERGIHNVRFEVGNVYDLPLPDGSFDAAFESNLLIYLREPVRALQEIRRVLKPGGVIGIADTDSGTMLREPSTPLWEQYRTLSARVSAHNGGDNSRGRHQRRLLLEAGFVHAEGIAVVVYSGTLEATRQMAAFLGGPLQEPAFAEVATMNGWADAAELEAMAEELRAWGERPDAFYAVTLCQALGWAPTVE